MTIASGARVRCFDAELWNGKDCRCGCNNGCFRKPCTILGIYWNGLWQCDVKFDHKEEVSRGHFISSLLPLNG